MAIRKPYQIARYIYSDLEAGKTVSLNGGNFKQVVKALHLLKYRYGHNGVYKCKNDKITCLCRFENVGPVQKNGKMRYLVYTAEAENALLLKSNGKE